MIGLREFAATESRHREVEFDLGSRESQIRELLILIPHNLFAGKHRPADARPDVVVPFAVRCARGSRSCSSRPGRIP